MMFVCRFFALNKFLLESKKPTNIVWNSFKLERS